MIDSPFDLHMFALLNMIKQSRHGSVTTVPYNSQNPVISLYTAYIEVHMHPIGFWREYNADAKGVCDVFTVSGEVTDKEIRITLTSTRRPETMIILILPVVEGAELTLTTPGPLKITRAECLQLLNVMLLSGNLISRSALVEFTTSLIEETADEDSYAHQVLEVSNEMSQELDD